MDEGLHENGEACPSCELRREEANKGISGAADVPCNNCGGTGRISFGADTVCRRSAAWAVKHYWPEIEKRWKLQASNRPIESNRLQT